MEKKPKSEKPVDSQEKKDELDNQNSQDQQIREMGQVLLSENQEDIRVELLTIIGEVEGHESAPSHSKTSDPFEYSRWRCGGGACHSGDDRIP